jgi:hypothetical protein
MTETKKPSEEGIFHFLHFTIGSSTNTATPIIKASDAIDNSLELKSTPMDSSRNAPATIHRGLGIVRQPQAKSLSYSVQLFLFTAGDIVGIL